MPIFELNKLVRDGLLEEYIKTDQKPEYHQLDFEAHKAALIAKIIEEVQELSSCNDKVELAGELADVYQAIDDYADLSKIDQSEVEDKKRAKYIKRGGFLKGVFIDTLELSDGDPWINYYRARPDIFPEKNE